MKRFCDPRCSQCSINKKCSMAILASATQAAIPLKGKTSFIDVLF